MCIIIDANIAHKFTSPPHEDVAPVVHWLTEPDEDGKVVVGGQLRRELDRAGDTIRHFLRALREAGRLIDKVDATVDAETSAVKTDFEKLQLGHADDPHIIALARISGSRLLASHDKNSRLHANFKNPKLLKPRGRIYQNATHEKLLKRAPRCKTCRK